MYLKEIIKRKEKEVEKLIELAKDPKHPLCTILKKEKKSDYPFANALSGPNLSVIAEIKRNSPSLGEIRTIDDPVDLAMQYVKGGASAISVLTDLHGFGGSLEDLKKIAESLPNIPLLRKDFIIHPLQLAEAALAGASAVLLIVSVLKDNLKTMIDEANRLGLETVVEVHDELELKMALDAKSRIIGINHRNLSTFEIDLNLSKTLRPLIPSNVLTIAESGIHNEFQAKRMFQLGYNAILVGEALVRTNDSSSLIKNMSVKICGVTHPDDADFAALAGADYIGIIFSPLSKRHVSLEQGKEIAKQARKGGSEPVAVFVNECADEIIAICEETGIKTVQLHGDISKEAFSELDYTIIYATSPSNNYPKGVTPLFDSPGGGTGEMFDYTTFTSPKESDWFLAGGLTPNNVADACTKLNPKGVDVASGVEYPNSSRKDPNLVKDFIRKAKKHPYPFGGQFVPELLVNPLQSLSKAWESLANDPSFRGELDHLLETYAGRPTPLTEVKNFAKAIDGPHIFLKREDLLHTGAHKINNALGQCLLAKRLGKTRVIAETGAGQHGVATATACAFLGLTCVVYMGSVDIERQKLNVEKMKLLGAQVVSVNQGSATLKDAINEALRDWASNYETSHYCLGSALGPAPYPDMVRSFQSIISLEVKRQIPSPDLLIACIGGGSNAIGFFHHFINDSNVKLVGVEAGGKGKSEGEHAARFASGSPGVLHGCYTYLLQNQDGQILPTHSISAGLDYPAIGPAHSILYESGRASYEIATDDEALDAFHLLTKTEGIIPALESSHALAYLIKIAPTLDKNMTVIVNLSGRGDKDLSQVITYGEKNE